MADKLENKDTPEKTEKITKLNLKFDEMMKSIQEKEIKLDTIQQGPKKDIIIGRCCRSVWSKVQKKNVWKFWRFKHI